MKAEITNTLPGISSSFARNIFGKHKNFSLVGLASYIMKY